MTLREGGAWVNVRNLHAGRWVQAGRDCELYDTPNGGVEWRIKRR